MIASQLIDKIENTDKYADCAPARIALLGAVVLLHCGNGDFDLESDEGVEDACRAMILRAESICDQVDASACMGKGSIQLWEMIRFLTGGMLWLELANEDWGDFA